MDNIVTKHVGIFDFWGIFCVGIVILTSFVVLVMSQGFLSLCSSSFTIFLYIVIAYAIGLILHSLSSTLIDCGLSVFNTANVLTANYGKQLLFKKYYHNFLLNNDQISDETKAMGFQRCYNFLKHKGLSYRIDKLHSIYVMSRGIFLGYIILSVIALVNLFYHFIKIEHSLNIFSLIVYLILMTNFYVMAKKYFYRWVEWVLIEYQYRKNGEEDKVGNETKT